MTKPPLVSVVIPAFNCEAFVAEAVRSVLAQDYPSIEVIVVNDGSTDGTMAVLRSFGNAIHIVDQVNGGPPRARNAGLRAATGDYIAFQDADDVWIQGKLAVQVAHLEANPDVGTCSTRWHIWPPDSAGRFTVPAFANEPIRAVAVDPVRSGWVYGRLLFDCELLTTTVMIRTSVVRAVGDFDLNLFNGDDYDYWIRLSRASKITRLDVVGALYRVVPGSVSRKPRATNFEQVVIQSALKRYGLVGPDGIAVDPRAMQRRLERLEFQHGYQHLKWGDPTIALQSFMTILKRQPWRLRLWAHALQALWKASARGTANREAVLR